MNHVWRHRYIRMYEYIQNVCLNYGVTSLSIPCINCLLRILSDFRTLGTQLITVMNSGLQ